MIENIFLGTYTKQDSQGIYQVQLDSESSQLKNLQLVTEVDNPTYLAISKNNHLYAVDKFDNQGGLSVTDLNQDNKVIQHIVELGTPPAYVTVNSNQTTVFDANYHEGLLHAYSIGVDGKLTLENTFKNSGSGPKKEQDGSHLHYVDEIPDGNLVACDLGTDEVFILKYTDQGFKKISVYHTAPGFGPRHIVFNTAGTTAYLVGELGSAVEVLEYTNGNFKHQQTIKTIPTDYTDHNGCAAVRLSSDNKYLYVSNRGYDSIACFEIETDHQLKLIQNISVQGSFPRDFALNSDEKYLVCSNQNTNNLTLFSRNPSDGTLKLIQDNFYAPEVVCVYFN